MRLTSLLIPAVWLISLPSLASGQSLEAKLKQRVDTFDSQNDSACGQLIELAQQFHVPMGVEWVDQPSLRAAHPIHVKDTTVQDTIHSILAKHPGYSYDSRDGVIHIYQPSVVGDPRNFLNIRFPEFGYKDESLSVGSYWLRVQIITLLHPGQGFAGGYGGFSQYRDFDLPLITFSGQGLTVRQILSKMVALEGNALWVVGIKPTQMMRDEPYYAPLTWYKGGEVSTDFTWQFIPWDPHAFAELTFAKEFTEQLSKAGVKVSQVGRSVEEGHFSNNFNAALIVTDKGSVDAVFFSDPGAVEKIKITGLGMNQNGHYEYLIENPPDKEREIESAEEEYYTKLGKVLYGFEEVTMQ